MSKEHACAYEVGYQEGLTASYVELRDEIVRLEAECDEWHRVAECKQHIIDDLRAAVHGRVKSVYLVMASDDLMEDGTPLRACLDVDAATERAREEERTDADGIRHFAWVEEVKVVAE